MKKKLLCVTVFLLLLICGLTCFAQKAEVSAGISGNLTNYSGSAASSSIIYGNFPVFSKTLTAGYGLNAEVKLISKSGFLIGLQSGYDVLRSKANSTDPIYSDPGFYTINTSYIGSASGTVTGFETDTRKFANINPYIGYRIKKAKYCVDILLGNEIAFAVESKQHSVHENYYTEDRIFYYNQPYNNFQKLAGQDYRLKGGLCINYKRLTVDISYAHGINTLIYKNPNYKYNYDQGSAYSQVIRLGVAYRIF